MTYQYTDASREKDPHALPDVELFHIGTIKDWKDPFDCYRCSDWATSKDGEGSHSEHIGWYYAFGFPGCLWDSEPDGPHDTEEKALTAAREAAGF